MEGFDLLQTSYWQPLAHFGFTHSFFNLNMATIINTWLVLIVLLILCLVMGFFLKYKNGKIRFIATSFVASFIDLCEQIVGFFSAAHTGFIISIFLFILLCNCISVLPWTEEPTQDLNTTLALGIIVFIYCQAAAILHNGFWNYIKEYFAPFLIMLPLNIISKLASVVSISFRLFGNIFGGATIVAIYMSAIQGSILFETAGLLGLNWIMVGFFILFEGFLQAFVFAMLSFSYLSIAIHGESGDEQ